MASVTKLSKEELAAVKSLINGAAGKVSLDESLTQKGETITQGLLWNQTKDMKDLVVYDKHIWLGDLTTPFDTPLVYSMQGQPSIFVLQGTNGSNSKGGVVYVDGVENSDRKWTVAFDGLFYKVYVEAGPIGPTHWENVEVRLNDSGSESSSVDPVYGGKAHAEIRPFEGRSLLSVWFAN